MLRMSCWTPGRERQSAAHLLISMGRNWGWLSPEPWEARTPPASQLSLWQQLICKQQLPKHGWLSAVSLSPPEEWGLFMGSSTLNAPLTHLSPSQFSHSQGQAKKEHNQPQTPFGNLRKELTLLPAYFPVGCEGRKVEPMVWEQQSPRQVLLAQSLVRTKWRSSLAKIVSHGSEVKGENWNTLMWSRGLKQVMGLPPPTVNFWGHKEGHQGLEGNWPPHCEPQELSRTSHLLPTTIHMSSYSSGAEGLN